MIADINLETFPEQSYDFIVSRSQEPNFKNIVLFELREEANSVLSEDKLTAFSKLCESLDPKIKIYFFGLNYVSVDKGLALLKQYSLMDRLTHASFRDLAVLSEEATDLVLDDPILRARLNAIQFDDPRQTIDFKRVVDSDEVYSPLAMRQTFHSSCAARVILDILVEAGWLRNDERTPAKELEIYKQIWVAPGTYAHPHKLVDFLNRFFKKPALTAYDLQARRKECLASATDMTAEIGRSAFSLFKSRMQDNMVKIKPGDPIDETLFKPGIISLLIHRTIDGGTHTVFGQRLKDGGYKITDPGFGTEVAYVSFLDYMNSKEKFMGVTINIQLDRSFPQMYLAYQSFLELREQKSHGTDTRPAL